MMASVKVHNDIERAQRFLSIILSIIIAGTCEPHEATVAEVQQLVKRFGKDVSTVVRRSRMRVLAIIPQEHVVQSANRYTLMLSNISKCLRPSRTNASLCNAGVSLDYGSDSVSRDCRDCLLQGQNRSPHHVVGGNDFCLPGGCRC